MTPADPSRQSYKWLLFLLISSLVIALVVQMNR